uniref:S-locus-specific glycoprotein S6 n=1 Tax=Cajanus cajan TaxID=3821 RepID=A0A151SVW2_CAJCA|nr:S-locus-specific glycoprotein S6 [Cajanus cajan]
MSFSNDAKLFFVLFILCCDVLNVGIAIDSITSSQSMKDPDTLSSKDGNFTLGFFTPQNSTKRYVGIWWKSESTVIWVANRNQPNSPQKPKEFIFFLLFEVSLPLIFELGCFLSRLEPSSIRVPPSIKLHFIR